MMHWLTVMKVKNTCTHFGFSVWDKYVCRGSDCLFSAESPFVTEERFFSGLSNDLDADIIYDPQKLFNDQTDAGHK